MVDMTTQTEHSKAVKAACSKRWRESHKEEIAAKKREAYLANPEAQRERERRYYNKLREDILNHYGRVCVLCGSTDNPCLDHVNSNGRQHRLSFGSINACDKVWAALRRQGFPQEGYRILCSICNLKEYWRQKRNVPNGG